MQQILKEIYYTKKNNYITAHFGDDNMFKDMVVLRGAGDIASGIAYRLYRSGFRVLMLETEKPLVVRRKVAFAQAVYEGNTEIEGIKAVKITGVKEINWCFDRGILPVLVDPECNVRSEIRTDIIVDAILAKKNLGTTIDMAPITIGVGPGFTAGKDVHAVVETNRGHNLGRVILAGTAEKDTGIPGNVCGYTYERVLRAPCSGIVSVNKEIGQSAKKGDIICMVDDLPVRAMINGVVRGLINNIDVTEGMKIGDIDPRGIKENCFTISDKARAVAGGVLEAILYLKWVKGIK